MNARLWWVAAWLLAAGPAHAAPFVVLEEGYTPVQLAVEWAQPNAYFQPPGPLMDAAGNAYQLAGDAGIGHAGPRIVRLSEQGLSTFAETDGPGQPRFVAFAFDDNQQMVVVVERWVGLPDRGTAIVRSYHRIRGFPAREKGGLAPRVQALVDRFLPAKAADGGAALSPLAPIALIVGLLAVALTVMLRQLVRDARRLRSRG